MTVRNIFGDDRTCTNYHIVTYLYTRQNYSTCAHKTALTDSNTPCQGRIRCDMHIICELAVVFYYSTSVNYTVSADIGPYVDDCPCRD